MEEVNQEIRKIVRKRNGEISSERESAQLGAARDEKRLQPPEESPRQPDSPGTQILKVRKQAKRKIISPDINFKIQLTN